MDKIRFYSRDWWLIAIMALTGLQDIGLHHWATLGTPLLVMVLMARIGLLQKEVER